MDISRLLPVFASLREQATASPDAMIKENLTLGSRHESMTAVFTGATHGIGLATLQAFVKHIPKPRAFIIGRSKEKFAKELQALQAMNPDAELIFLEAQLSLIREVDRICIELEERLSPRSIDLLCMSQGYAPMGEREFTEEGLDEAIGSLVVYGRIRMAERLGADGLLKKNSRVVSVAGGGKEGHLLLDDLELKSNYSIMNLRGHFTTMITLAFDSLAKRYPNIGFVHVYPGTVSTGLLSRGGARFPTSLLLKSVETLMSFFAMTAAESGERTLWAATTDRFLAGSFSINHDGTLSTSEKLAEYRKTPEAAEIVWGHLRGLFARALERGQSQ